MLCSLHTYYVSYIIGSNPLWYRTGHSTRSALIKMDLPACCLLPLLNALSSTARASFNEKLGWIKAAITKEKRQWDTPFSTPLSKGGACLGYRGQRSPLTCGWRPVWRTSCRWRTQSSRSQPQPRSYWEGKIYSSGLWTPSRTVGTGKPGAALAWLGAERIRIGKKIGRANVDATAYDIFISMKVKCRLMINAYLKFTK